MIFNLFESRKDKWKKRLIKGFDIYIPGVQGLDAEEIGETGFFLFRYI